MQTILKLALWVLLVLPLLGQNPIIFGGKRSPARSGAQGIWMMQNPNLLYYSEDLTNSVWSKRGTTSISSDAVVAPDGTLTADTVSGLGAVSSNDLYQLATDFASSDERISFWIKRISTSGILRIINPIGGSGARGTIQVDMSLLPDSWYRVTESSSAVTVTNTFLSSTLGTTGVQLYASSGAPLSFSIWGIQLSSGTMTLPYASVTNAQSYPNLVSGGAALQRGSTSGTDTSDPTRRGVGLYFDSIDDRISNIPAKGSVWTVVNCSETHCYGVDSAGGSYVDGKAQAGALEFSLQTAGGYSGLLTVLGQWSRVLTAKEHWKDYFTYIRPNVNKAGGSLP